MPDNSQSSPQPIGFSRKNGNPTKGGSVGTDEGLHKPNPNPTTHNPSPSSLVPHPSSPNPHLLSPFEEKCIECFVEIATGFNLPRSVGEIFGLVYASPDPVPFDGVMQRLHLSKASTSTGLKFLQRLGALRTVYVGGDRRTFYEPEMSFNRLLKSLVNETVMPHLRKSNTHVAEMQILLDSVGEGERDVLKQRVEQFTRWRDRASSVLPKLLRIGSLQ